jgi:DNA-binding response OmpR family regulator
VATVLVVDDDPHFREFLRILLTKEGLEVRLARSAAEGKEQLNSRPDLLIVDHRMPNEDGYSWISSIRDAGNNLPIIFCSGSGCDQKYIERLRSILNVDLILPKPIDPVYFVKQVRKLLKLDQGASSKSSSSISNQPVQPGRHHQKPSGKHAKERRGPATNSPASGEIKAGVNVHPVFNVSKCEGQRPPVNEKTKAQQAMGQLVSNTQDKLPDPVDSECREFVLGLSGMLSYIRLNILFGAVDDDGATIGKAISLADDLLKGASRYDLPQLKSLILMIEGSLQEGLLIDRRDAETFHVALQALETADSCSQSLMSQLGEQRCEPSVVLPAMLVSESAIRESQALVDCAVQNELPVDSSEVMIDSLVPPAAGNTSSDLSPLSNYESTLTEVDGASHGRSRTRCVVVVSDDQNLVSSCKQSIEADNDTVFTAKNRDLAIVAITRHQPDIVLVDETIALAGAADFCHFVKECFGNKSLILVLIRDAERRHFAIAHQADDYVLIPVAKYELARRMAGEIREYSL